jgi:hypothetical protein
MTLILTQQEKDTLEQMGLALSKAFLLAVGRRDRLSAGARDPEDMARKGLPVMKAFLNIREILDGAVVTDNTEIPLEGAAGKFLKVLEDDLTEAFGYTQHRAVTPRARNDENFVSQEQLPVISEYIETLRTVSRARSLAPAAIPG